MKVASLLPVLCSFNVPPGAIVASAGDVAVDHSCEAGPSVSTVSQDPRISPLMRMRYLPAAIGTAAFACSPGPTARCTCTCVLFAGSALQNTPVSTGRIDGCG